MKILLKNATIINEKSQFHNETLDILIENGIVSQIKKDIDIDADSIINKKIFMFRLAGLIQIFLLENLDLN